MSQSQRAYAVDRALDGTARPSSVLQVARVGYPTFHDIPALQLPNNPSCCSLRSNTAGRDQMKNINSIPRGYWAVFALIVIVLSLPARSGAQTSTTAPDSAGLGDVLQYIGNAWGTLTRSMDECKTFVDERKQQGKALLYFPADMQIRPSLPNWSANVESRPSACLRQLLAPDPLRCRCSRSTDCSICHILM